MATYPVCDSMASMFKQIVQYVLCFVAVICFLNSGSRSQAQSVAQSPPLRWNSWDSYGLSVTEAEWKSNVAWFHQHLQPAGWQYVVLDEGWYLAHPENAGYLAVFNLAEVPGVTSLSWREIGLTSGKHRIHDIWAQRDLPPADKLVVTLAPHGSALYLVE